MPKGKRQAPIPQMIDFKKRRLALGLSQTQLAAVSAVSLNLYNILESGRHQNPGYKTLGRIDCALVKLEAKILTQPAV